MINVFSSGKFAAVFYSGKLYNGWFPFSGNYFRGKHLKDFYYTCQVSRLRIEKLDVTPISNFSRLVETLEPLQSFLTHFEKFIDYLKKLKQG